MPITSAPSISITRTDLAADKLLDDLLPRLKRLLFIDFEAHDARLRDCLLSAIDELEQYTARLIVSGTVTVSWSELYDGENLPWGPVTGSITATDLAGTALVITPELSGEFPALPGDYPAGISLSYSAGYTATIGDEAGTVPIQLKEAICANAANEFDAGTRNWQKKAATLRRVSWAH